MTKKILNIWVCDYSENTGEGRLARLFIQNLKLNQKNRLRFNQKKILRNKYFSTIQGIIFCWIKYLNNQRVCYLNYLPLWNFLIFIFLPPKTILGPITGGADYSKNINLNFFIRAFIFPIFYKLSELFLNIRLRKILFSTDLLKKNLSAITIKKSEFNFVLKFFSLRKKKKKKIDFLIYYRKHKNKKDLFPYDFVKKIIKLKFKISIIGDKLNYPGVKNYGNISNRKVLYLQSISKYTIASGENLYSFFVLECLSNNVKIIIDKLQNSKIKFLKKNFIGLYYNSKNILKNLKKL